ncbi:MAG TPA: hypothetical protein VML19_13370 [Verrucomicrobiae bacterium]|nr:hypothetical protein [Verrucomicrobiae bacterium]
MSNSEDEARGSEENGRDAGMGNEDVAGRQPPFEGRQPPFEGRQPPFEGRQPPFEGKQSGGGAGGGRVFLGGSSRETGVVVRATVESFGLVGETELNVSVKWPAGCNSSPIVEPVKRTAKPPGGSANVT